MAVRVRTWNISQLQFVTEQRYHWYNVARGQRTPCPAIMGPSHLWLYPGTLTTSCSRPLPFWNPPGSNPSSHPAAKRPWTNMELKTVRFSQNINKLCYKWLILFPSSDAQQKQPWFPGNGHVLGFCVLRRPLPHRLFELHIIIYIVFHLQAVLAGSV